MLRIAVSDPTIASASIASGQVVVRALRPGRANVVTSATDARATVSVVVAALGVESVVLSPDALTLKVGETRQLSARLLDRQGRTLEGPVVWSSDNGASLAVSPSGLLTARSSAAGVRVTAQASNGRHGIARVDVVGAGPTTDGTDNASTAEKAIADRNQAVVDLIAKKDFDALGSLYRAEPGTGADWKEKLVALVREDLLSAAIAGQQVTVDDRGATSTLTVAIKFQDPVAGGRRSGTLSFLVRYDRLGDQWNIRSLSLTKRPPS
jgi:hypothetical protein